MNLRQHKRRAYQGMADRFAELHAVMRSYPVFEGCTPTIGWWVLRHDWRRNARGLCPIRMGRQPGFQHS